MIFYFTGALLISAALIKLGSYATFVAMMLAASKVLGALLILAMLVLLFLKLRGSAQISRLSSDSDR